LTASVCVAELDVEVLVDDTEVLVELEAAGGEAAQTVPKSAGSLNVSLNEPLDTPYFVPVVVTPDRLTL
jgi:hypothetical protein